MFTYVTYVDRDATVNMPYNNNNNNNNNNMYMYDEYQFRMSMYTTRLLQTLSPYLIMSLILIIAVSLFACVYLVYICRW